MKNKYVFSIITINYNGINGLRQTLASVANQTFENFEYVVIDGGSSDGSKELIESYRENIDFWVSEPDNGIYDAMNKGLKKVTGDYVYFLNSGDYFLFPEVLNLIDKEISKTSPDFLMAGVLKSNPSTGEYSAEPPSIIDKISLFKKMVCHQALFVNKTIFNEIGDFDLSYKLKGDYEWLLRAVNHKNYKFEYFDAVITFYPLEGASDTLYSKYSVKEIPAIRKRYFTPKNEIFLRRYIYRPLLASIMKKALMNKQFREAILKKISH